MGLLNKYGIPVPRGQIAHTPEEAYKAAQLLSRTFSACNWPRLTASWAETDDLVVKAQVLAGGRGKGTLDSGVVGGVQTASSPEEVRDLAQKMIGRRLVTRQTGAAGRPCNSVGPHHPSPCRFASETGQRFMWLNGCTRARTFIWPSFWTASHTYAPGPHG